MSYSERGSKMTIVKVLQPKIDYLCLLVQYTFTDQPIKTGHEINAAWR